MGILKRILRRFSRDQEVPRIVLDLLRSDQWWRAWIALGMAWLFLYLLIWQLIEPLGIPDFIPRIQSPRWYIHVFASLLVALVCMLALVDYLRRWLWRRYQQQPEAEAGPAPGQGAGGPLTPPPLPELPQGPREEVPFQAVDYVKWTKAFALQEFNGTAAFSGKIFERDTHTGQVLIMPSFLHREAFMGALSLYDVPSPVTAWLSMYKKTDDGRISAKITAHFDLHEGKVAMVGGPEDDQATAQKVVNGVADRMRK